MKRISYPIIKLIIVVIVVGGALAYFYRDKFYCNYRSAVQKGLCGIMGGEFSSKIAAIGFSTKTAFGCFPKGKTTDGGKPCEHGIDCQGYCLWLAGDVVSDYSHKTCSDYKQAIPVCLPK